MATVNQKLWGESMIKSACSLMKKAVVSSVVLFLSGIVLVLVAQQLSLQSALPATFLALGFISIVVGVVIMAVTIIAIMLPKVSRQLELCQH
ncbi:MAG: hypothetical protein U9Q75_08890 [Pseudomonadota bacterium]|nr:hypothetical protein [Pseudomonadota bacterium]